MHNGSLYIPQLTMSVNYLLFKITVVYEKSFCSPVVSWVSGGKGNKLSSSIIIGFNRPLGLQEVQAPRISRQLAHAEGKLSALRHIAR
jgi:hypothetical protein